MFPIYPHSPLVTLIRNRASALREKSSSTESAGTATQKSQELPTSSQSTVRRIAGIAHDDPQRQRKAFRIFLESTLLAELSPELMNDPDFHTMVDAIQEQMESDAELAQPIRDAADLLLKLATSNR